MRNVIFLISHTSYLHTDDYLNFLQNLRDPMQTVCVRAVSTDFSFYSPGVSIRASLNLPAKPQREQKTAERRKKKARGKKARTRITRVCASSGVISRARYVSLMELARLRGARNYRENKFRAARSKALIEPARASPPRRRPPFSATRVCVCIRYSRSSLGFFFISSHPGCSGLFSTLENCIALRDAPK